MDDASNDNDKIAEAAKKLPFSERVVHKSWFVRAAAFEDLGAACKRALDPEDPIFAEAGPLFVKGVADANANAQDKALEALLLFLENTTEQQAARIAAPTCFNMATKVLKGRPGTVKKATDCFLAFLEWEQVEEVMEPLFKAFGDKVPKTVVAAVDIVALAFGLFGPKVVKPQPIAKALPALFDAKAAPVRDGVKKVAVELRAWLGADYVQGSLCGKMPDQMRKDVEKLMEECPASKTQPERFTRKEQAIRAAAAEAAAAAAAEGGGPQAEGGSGAALPSANAAGSSPQEADSYEYSEPADIWGSLNKEFWEGLASKKWTERRDSLQKFKGLASQPRLAPGDYGEVLRELKKVILKDSNVVCVGEAITCVGALAKSLRGSFSSSAKGFVSVMLEKYKDPKTSINTAVTGSLRQIHTYCLSLSDLAEDLGGALAHKNPKIKEATAKLLQACVDSLSKQDAAKVHGALLPLVGKAANDPAPEVREANMEVLVSFALKAGNLGLLEKVSDGFDDVRKKRLNELAQQRTGSGKPAVAVPESAPQSSLPPKSPARPVTRSTRAAAEGSASKPASRPAPKKAAGAGAAATAAASAGPADNDDAALAGGTLSDSDLREKMLELLGEEIMTGLQDAQWKARLTSMEEMMGKVQGLGEVSPEVASNLIQGIAVVPGWSEKNFQVLSKGFEVVTYLVGQTSVSKKDAFIAMGGLVDKMSDIKLKGPAGDALFAISEALGPQFTFTQLHKKAAAHKNPKVLSESLLWMAKAVEEFGLATINVQQLIEWTKGDLGSTNAAVRNAATQLMATCHRQLGPDLAAMIRNDVKPALMTALEEAFKKNPRTQVVPTRFVRNAKPKKAAGGGRAAAAGAAEVEDAAPDLDDLLPRTDISGQVGGKVMAGLGSTNWKERNHTMDDIENIIRTAARIQPNVGDLIQGLKARLSDSNKNLVARALTIFGELAKAMGPAWERVGRPVLTNTVTFIADNKSQVRNAAVGALDAWVAAVPADKVLPAVVDFLPSAKASNEGKVVGLRWLMAAVEAGRAQRCLDSALKAAAVASGDKAVEVREAASHLAAALVKAHGEEMGGAMEGLPGPVKKAASDLLNKQGGSTSVAVGAGNGRSHAPAPVATEPAPSGARSAASGAARSGRPSPLRVSHSRAPSSRENSVPNTPSTDGPCLHFSSKKEERIQKARFKSNKFEAPREYEVEELQEDWGNLASEPLRRLMFAKDFKRHMEAADLVLSQLADLPREALSCMDLLLRWLTVRICDANTQCLLKVLDLTKALFQLMIDQGYHLTDGESHSILPCLVEKSGHNQDRLRQYNKEIIRLARKLLTSGRMVEYLMQGFSSKNNRTRVDCVELLGDMLEEEGLAQCTRNKQKPFAAIAQMVTERDKALRSAVLSTLAQLYQQEGEATVWTQCGRLSDQQRSLIEERFKHTSRIPQAKASSQRSPHPRLDGYSNASDHSEPPSPAASRVPRLDLSRSGMKSKVEALQGMPSLPTSSDTIPSGRMHQQPETPPPRGMAPSDIPTPMPGKTPGDPMGQGTSPPPSEVAPMEEQDDEEMHNTFTEALFLVAGDDRFETVEGAKRICFVLQAAAEGQTSQEFQTFLAHSATELLKALTHNIDKEFDWAVKEHHATGEPASARACKYMVNATMMIFDVPAMPRAIPMNDLKDLIFVMLAKLLDNTVHHALADNPEIMKAINVLMLKLISNNFGNPILEALIQLLMVPPIKLMDRGMDAAAYTQLLTRCLVKASRLLPERYKEIDIQQLLKVVHHYFMSLGVDEIRRRGVESEKSLRMVKTMVHELCRLLGEDIRQHMQAIPRDSDPIPLIHVYVDLHLLTLQDAGLLEAPQAGENSAPLNSARSFRDAEKAGVGEISQARSGSLGGSIHARSPSMQLNLPTALPTQRSSKDLKTQGAHPNAAKDSLLPILQRIGDGSTSEQGLEELRRFMKEHPEVDTKPFMARLSKDFHAFVEKGLARLERRERMSAGRLSSEPSSLVNSHERLPSVSQEPPLAGHHHRHTAASVSAESITARLGGLRMGSTSPTDSSAVPKTMREVEQMQERMRSLSRVPAPSSRPAEH